VFPKCCNLKFQTGEEFYSCVFQNGYFAKSQPLNFCCKHPHGVTNDYVYNVQFEFSIMEKIPVGLAEKFPNLKILNIFKSRLKEISKNDLLEYKNLERFFCSGNELEILPGDLF